MSDSKGSTWNKWDLHVHSPASKGFTGSWTQFENQLKNSEANVIGINDYFSVAGYKYIEEKIKKGSLDIGNKEILPVVEFRMRDVLKNRHTGQSGKKINFHVIFSNEVGVSAIETFIKSLKVNNALIGDKYEDKDYLGNTARVYFEADVIDALKDNDDFKDRYILWLPYDEYGGIGEIDPDTDDWIKADFIRKAHLLGSSNKLQIEFFLWKSPIKPDGSPKFKHQQFESWFGLKKGSIKGSDSHSHSYPIGRLKDRNSQPIEKYCWIKGEPTFETIKQIVFEPEGRVYIGKDKPVEPTNTIESFTFNIPKDSTISVEQKDGTFKQENFCFAGEVNQYQLSPYFNCFIGGRGTGKSTILNFLGIHSRDPQSSQDFWKRLRPSFSPDDRGIFDFSGVGTFEFIGQSEVESFATNKKAFTEAIYKRANLRSDNKLSEQEELLETSKDEINKIKNLIIESKNLKADKAGEEESKKTLGKSLKVTESDDYKEIAEEITKKSSQKNDLEDWRGRIVELKDTIEAFRTLENEDDDDYDYDDDSGNEVPEQLTESNKNIEFEQLSQPYQKAYESAQRHVDTALNKLDPSNFEELEKIEKKLIADIEKLENKLSKLLQKSGLSEENILQAKGAPQKIVKINETITKIQNKISDNEVQIKKYDEKVQLLVAGKKRYESAIEEAIQPLVETLEEQAAENKQEDIKDIGLTYYFDDNLAWERVVDEFIKEFEDEYEFDGRRDALKNFILAHKAVFSAGQNEINALLRKEDGDSNYASFLTDVFKDADNFEIFKCLRDLHLNDVSNFRKIQVLYDRRDIENASFGQKCTAVIVVLILFGNYPLIIDEPEAHLDSSLIANYLVPLIKRNKKNRQIIFATHNANFVVNGDAEKVFILKNDDGQVDFTQSTIEDIDSRNELLKLEGGKEAFRQRSDKLNIL